MISNSNSDRRAFQYARDISALGHNFNVVYDAVEFGYHMAVKDFALTRVEDIATIMQIERDVNADNNYLQNTQDALAKEVFRRFSNYMEKI